MRIAAFVFALCGVLAITWTLYPLDGSRVESLYSLGVYTRLAAWIIPLTDPFEMPIGFWASALAALLILVASVVAWFRYRSRGIARWRITVVGVVALNLLAVFVYSIVLLTWAAGYRSRSLEDRLGLAGHDDVNADEARAFVARLVDTIRRDYTPPEDRDVPRALDSLRRSLAASYRDWYGIEPTLPVHVKRLPAGTLLRFGSSGMAWPLTLEATVDAALPDTALVAVAAHELAHVAGLTRESDADFAAAVAGLRCDDAFARYAVSLRLYSAFSSELDEASQEAFREALPAGARADREAAREVYSRYVVRSLARIQRVVYDQHLRVQGIEDGIANYSRALRLILDADRRGLLTFADPDAGNR